MASRKGPRSPCEQRVVSRHEQAIRDLLASDPRIMRNGFWAAVSELADDLDYEIRLGGFLPDAYRIDREACEIVMHEVVDHCDLAPKKLASIGDFWMDWDGEGDTDWLPTLFVHRLAYPVAPQEVDLCAVCHQFTIGEDA
jgi:hypothetical protein